MKKSLICGAASLVMAAAPMFAFAEAPQAGTADGYMEGTHDVTVGEVDEPLYSVDINWGDLSFDWKYNKTTNDFSFKAYSDCYETAIMPDGREWIEQQQANNVLFSNDACTEPYTGNIQDGTTYYYTEELLGRNITLVDWSVNGKIRADISFATENKYSWVTGLFGTEIGTGYDPDSGLDVPFVPQFAAFEDGNFLHQETVEYDEDGKIGIHYGAILKLDKNPDATVSAGSVVSGDKIGTVTISISPDID